MAQFSLSWEAYKQNICSGLSALQRNGEFVDMTLAADGHHVKVHQMVMSLVSPYIKDLITSASCPHPVIFLNKISYPILCAILEYIYTGEVMVNKENLNDLVEAGKELHIKGLEDMKLELSSQQLTSQAMVAKYNEGQPLAASVFFKDAQEVEIEHKHSHLKSRTKTERTSHEEDTFLGDDSHLMNSPEHTYESMDTDHEDTRTNIAPGPTKRTKKTTSTGGVTDTRIQYTISNQGSLQMILNRFMYNLRYTSRKSGHRNWCCVDKRDKKCPATVITNQDVAIKRFSAHNHPFHDRRILKKIADKAVYSALNEAQVFGESKKQAKKENILYPTKDSE